MTRSLLATLAGLAALCILPGASMAQWSPDSLQNLEVCDQTGEQSVPKIAATSDGGCFVTWFDSRSGGYCMYIQRLDSEGVEQFGEDGLLVSDESQQSWLVDYSLAVDGDDDAVIVFSDTRNTPDELDVAAYKISSTGEFLWGADGICLSNTTEASFEAPASVAVTAAGNSIVAWGSSGDDYTIVLQKLSPEGTKLWGEYGITLDDPVRSLALPQVIPAGQDSAIVLFKSSTGSYPYQTTWLYCGMLDTAGGWAWNDTPILVYDSGHVSPWTTPAIVPDGEGGAVLSWYDSIDMSTFEVWVQHIDADGNVMFPMNGAQASTNSDNRLHMYPSPAFDATGDRALVFWVEENDGQSQYGVYGQMLSSSGERLWTDSGLELLPLGTEQISFVRALADPAGVYVGYLAGASGTAVRAIRVGFDGIEDWGPVTLSAASLGGKDDLVDCTGLWGSALYAWCDYRNDYGIYAQNVNPDGSTGPSTGIGEGPGLTAAGLSAWPNPSCGQVFFELSVPFGGLTTLEVFDITGRLVETLLSSGMQQGQYSLAWDAGGSAAPGVYFARMTSGSHRIERRLVLLPR